MKYAVCTVVDQTYAFLMENGDLTIRHPGAKLFDNKDEAQKTLEVDFAESLKMQKEYKVDPSVWLEIDDYWIMDVENEEEFRGRPDTW